MPCQQVAARQVIPAVLGEGYYQSIVISWRSNWAQEFLPEMSFLYKILIDSGSKRIKKNACMWSVNAIACLDLLVCSIKVS